MAIKTPFTSKIWWVGIIFTLFLMVGSVKDVPAQTAEQVWSPPVNLSKSGSATASTVLVVPNGPIIALWKDQFDGFVFTRLVDGQWEPPKAVDFPFADSDAAPILLADSGGGVHAFWLDQESSLFYSSTTLENFGTTTWSGTASISESVTVFTAAVDAQNDLNVMYIRSLNTTDAPTGIYYRRRSAAGAAWVPPVLLYQSSYLRLLTTDQITMELLTRTGSDGQTTLYATWDNRPRGQLFLSISPDAGETWGEPIEIRGPGNSTAAPLAIGMTLTNDQLLFLWQEKVTDTNCRQFYQTFSLAGEAVNSPQVMLSEFPVCPEGTQLIPLADGRVILQTNLFNLNYLLAWNGEAWSEPQIQSELSNFINPDTLQPINLKCLQTQSADDNQLLMIGCDNDLGGDMWFTSRELGATDSWFASASSWSQPLSFFSTESEISSLVLVPDSQGQLHALWSQVVPGTERDMEIYYARWDGKAWSYIVSIIQPPFKRANELAAAMDQTGRLYVVWSGGQSGEIYFSWANANLAGTPSEWAPPVVLPMLRHVGMTPDILVAEDGKIYVVYSIPLNENRGMYLTSSDNGGETWATPVLVADGVAAGWEVVGHPALSLSSTGDLHLLFWRLPPPDGLEPKGLYYSRSEDQGATWTAPEEIVRADLTSSWMNSYGNDLLYRVWQEVRSEVLVTYLDASSDQGITWNEPINFTDFDAVVENSDIVQDTSGKLYLIQLVKDPNAGMILQESLWDGKNWLKEEREVIDAEVVEGEHWLMQASVTSDGSLGVLLTNEIDDVLSTSSDMIFTSRKLEDGSPVNPPATPSAEPTLEATPSSTEGGEPTTAPEGTAPTPTTAPERAGSGSQPAIDTTILGPLVGLVASGLLVVLAFVVITKLANRNV